MALTENLVERLDTLLEIDGFPDLGPNGLQVPGRPEVERVVTGVTASRELIERAVELDAGLVVVHHGLFWDFHPTGLTPVLAERLRPLFRHDVNLAGYHLPLDAHPEVGNNAQLATLVGLERLEPFGAFKGRKIGCAGTLPGDGLPVAELGRRIAAVTEREPLLLPGGPAVVRRVGIVTGAAADALHEAADAGCDAFITGEPREHVTAEAAERGVHVFAAGHHATETFGVRRLGELLEREFGVQHLWIDTRNPV